MAFRVRNKPNESLRRKPSRRTNPGLTEATGLAASNEPEPKDRRASLWERTADLREDVARRIKNPAPLDKAFFDSLYDQRRNRDTHGE